MSAPRGRVDLEALKRPRLGERSRAMMIMGCDLRSDLAHDNHQNSNFLFRLR